MYSDCYTCHHARPVKHTVETYTRTFSWCNDCCQEDNNSLTDLTCVVCGNPSDQKYTDGIDFVKLHNAPSCQKLTCGAKHLQQLQEGFTHTIDPETLHAVCKYCGYTSNMTTTLSRCSRCKVAYYCNTDCQKADWDVHKLTCNK
jgi:hypothetical protein